LNMTEIPRSWFLSSASIPLYRKWSLKVDILLSVLGRTLFRNIDHGKEVPYPVWFLPWTMIYLLICLCSDALRFWSYMGLSDWG
jgi:hypothetical protein